MDTSANRQGTARTRPDLGSLASSSDTLRRLRQEQRRREIVLSPSTWKGIVHRTEEPLVPSPRLRSILAKDDAGAFRVCAMPAMALDWKAADQIFSNSGFKMLPSAASVSFFVREGTKPHGCIGGFTLQRQWISLTDGSTPTTPFHLEAPAAVRLTEFEVLDGPRFPERSHVLMRRVLERALELSDVQGYLALFADTGNDKARHLFQECGFLELGRAEPAFYLPFPPLAWPLLRAFPWLSRP